MKMLSQLPAAVCLAIIAGGVGCRESKKPEVVNVGQDTMLLRDLAEANKNTASARVDTVSPHPTSGGDSLKALVNEALSPERCAASQRQ